MSKTHEVCGMTLSKSPDGHPYCPWCNVNIAPKAEGQSPSLPPGSPSGVVEAVHEIRLAAKKTCILCAETLEALADRLEAGAPGPGSHGVEGRDHD